MSYFEVAMISLVFAGCGGLLGFVISDLKHQIDLFEANREDAKVYDYDDKEEK
jgi:hypothetical protein